MTLMQISPFLEAVIGRSSSRNTRCFDVHKRPFCCSGQWMDEVCCVLCEEDDRQTRQQMSPVRSDRGKKPIFLNFCDAKFLFYTVAFSTRNFPRFLLFFSRLGTLSGFLFYGRQKVEFHGIPSKKVFTSNKIYLSCQNSVHAVCGGCPSRSPLHKLA